MAKKGKLTRGKKRDMTREASTVLAYLKRRYESHEEIVADSDWQLMVARALRLDPTRMTGGSPGEERLSDTEERLRQATRRAMSILLENGYVYPTAVGFQLGQPRDYVDVDVSPDQRLPEY